MGSLSWKLEVSHNELESLPGWIGSLVELQAEGNRFQSLPMSMEFAKEGAAHLSKGHYEKAINAYNCALLLNPWDAVALHNRGDAKFALGRYEEAITDYHKAQGTNSNNAVARRKCSFAAYALGRYQEAIEDFIGVIQMNRYDSDAFFFKGDVEYKLERYKQVI